MSKFGFSGDNTLPTFSSDLASQGFVEGFRKRNYSRVELTGFQSLKTGDDEKRRPLILPLIDYNHVSEPDAGGAQTTLDVNMLSLTRQLGTDVRRLSARGGWQRPYVSPAGDIYTLSARLMGDAYYVTNTSLSGTSEIPTGLAHRLTPQVSMDWRYPFVRDEGSVYQLFEPIASLVVSPYGGNPGDIPNEDSRTFEFDDTNLFSPNRFSGIDRVEGGPRVNYGFKWGVFGEGGGNTTLLVGQSYRYKVDDTFASGSGLDDHFSDIVGRIHVAPSSYLDIYYRTRLDKKSLDARRNEVDFSAGVPAFRFSTRYAYFDRQEGSEFPGRKEITPSVSSQFGRFWRGNLSLIRDLAEKEYRTMNMNLVYEDECLLFSAGFTRTFFQNRDLHPENALMFRILFKTLGEVTPNVTVLNPNKTEN